MCPLRSARPGCSGDKYNLVFNRAPSKLGRGGCCRWASESLSLRRCLATLDVTDVLPDALLVEAVEARPVVRTADRDVDRNRLERVCVSTNGLQVRGRTRAVGDVPARTATTDGVVHGVPESDTDDDEREHHTLHARASAT